MGKIADEYELEITRDWVRRFKRVYEQQKSNPITVPDALESTRILIARLEREIKDYLAEQQGKKTHIQTTSTQADDVSVPTPMRELTTE